MKFTELKQKLADGELSNIYYLEGDDAFFRERGVAMLKEKFVTEPELNCLVLDGESALANPEEMLSAINQYPFLSEKRLVVVKEFYPKADFFKKYLAEIIEKPILETVLAFVNANSSDTLKKQTEIAFVNCEKADMPILKRYIKREVFNAGLTINESSAEKICEYSLCDMTKIVGETKKLISYSIKNGNIEDKDVENLCHKDTEYKIYEMTNCIGKRQADGVFSIIKDLISDGEPSQKLLISLYNYFKKLLLVSLSRDNDSVLAKQLNMKEYAVKKTREQALNFKKKALKNAIDALTDYDYMAKTGRITFDDALNLAIFKILA